MLHRMKKKNDINAGKWIGVGGKFEAEEGPIDCLLREAEEETGLRLTACRFRGIVTFVAAGKETEQMFLFTATAWEGELQADCAEGELQWIPKAQLPQLALWKGDEIFLRLLEEERPVFLLKLVYDAQDRLVEAALDGVPLSLPAAEEGEKE